MSHLHASLGSLDCFRPTPPAGIFNSRAVNTDGSLSRIQKWETLTAEERERTTRVVAARNEKRLKVLAALPPKTEEPVPTTTLPIEDTR